MFKMKRTIQRYHAALCRYEDQLMKKDRLLTESENLLSYMRKRLNDAEARIDALARENRRLSENADTDSDLVDMLYADNLDLMKQGRKVEDLEQENDKLWVENILLKAELLKIAPEKAREIGNRG